MLRRFAFGVVLVCGCRFRAVPATDTMRVTGTKEAPISAARGTLFLDENARRAQLARGPAPGYAGEMLEGCNYVVFLTDTVRQASAARKYFGSYARQCATGGQLLLRQVRYDFAQLYDWYIGPFMKVWQVKGVTSSSIFIQHNRIEVGVLPEATARVQRLLDGLPIPKDAIQIIPRMYDCAGTGGPSVVVNVRDQRGQPAAFGTTIVIQDGTFKDSVGGEHVAVSDVAVGAGNRRPGTYEVRLYKAGYKPIVLHDVKAPGDSVCHYATPSDVRDVTLEPLHP